MAKIIDRSAMCGTFAKRMGMSIVSLAQVEPKPLREIELPIFKVGDVFGGSYEIALALNSLNYLEFIFETQRGFVRVPLYGFFKEFILGKLDDQAFVKETVIPKYSGGVMDHLKDIYKLSLNEQDFAQRMIMFFKEHPVRIHASMEDPMTMVKFGKNPRDCKRGYTSYVLEFA